MTQRNKSSTIVNKKVSTSSFSSMTMLYEFLLGKQFTVGDLHKRFYVCRITANDLETVATILGLSFEKPVGESTSNNEAWYVFDSVNFTLIDLGSSLPKLSEVADDRAGDTARFYERINLIDLLALISLKTRDDRIPKISFKSGYARLSGSARLIGCFAAVAEGAGGKTSTLRVIAKATGGTYLVGGEPEINSTPLHMVMSCVVFHLLARSILLYGMENPKLYLPTATFCVDSLREWVYRDSPGSTTLSTGLNSGLLFALANLSVLCEQANVLLVVGVNPMNIKENDNANGLIRALVGSMTGVVRVDSTRLKRTTTGEILVEGSTLVIETRRLYNREQFEVAANELLALQKEEGRAVGMPTNGELSKLETYLMNKSYFKKKEKKGDSIQQSETVNFNYRKGPWGTTAGDLNETK